MWNPFAIRSNEARRLELRIVELEDDLGKAVRLIERIDARQRGRASKQPSPADSRAGDCGGAPCDDVRVPAPNGVVDGEAVYTKEQLRQFARQRGLTA